MDDVSKRFIIGLYGMFDDKKFRRDYREGFWGVEACSFGSEDDTLKLVEAGKRPGFRTGIHFPLRAGSSGVRDALFLARDEAVRLQAYDRIQQELDEIARMRVEPDYILFHYPKPVILDDRADWSRWRFADRSEFEFESRYTYEELEEKSGLLFEWLSAKGREYRFTPVLEFDALNRYVYGTDMLERLLDKHPSIRLCLDTGRMHLQERLDAHFDARAVLKKFARYAETIHLWNVRVTDGGVENSHYPALPGLEPAEDWAPIEDYLKIIAREQPAVKIMFEHRSELVSDEDLEACYRWVMRLMSPGRDNRAADTRIQP